MTPTTKMTPTQASQAKPVLPTPPTTTGLSIVQGPSIFSPTLPQRISQGETQYLFNRNGVMLEQTTKEGEDAILSLKNWKPSSPQTSGTAGTEITTTSSTKASNTPATNPATSAKPETKPNSAKPADSSKAATIENGTVTENCGKIELDKGQNSKVMHEMFINKDGKYVQINHKVGEMADEYNKAFDELQNMKSDDPKRAEKEAHLAGLHSRFTKLLAQNNIKFNETKDETTRLNIKIPADLKKFSTDAINKETDPVKKQKMQQINDLLTKFTIKADKKPPEIDSFMEDDNKTVKKDGGGNRSVACLIAELRAQLAPVEKKPAEHTKPTTQAASGTHKTPAESTSPTAPGVPANRASETSKPANQPVPTVPKAITNIETSKHLEPFANELGVDAKTLQTELKKILSLSADETLPANTSELKAQLLAKPNKFDLIKQLADGLGIDPNVLIDKAIGYYIQQKVQETSVDK